MIKSTNKNKTPYSIGLTISIVAIELLTVCLISLIDYYKLNVIFLILGILIIIIFGVMIAKRFTKPILDLNQSAKELANGNWDIKVDNNRSDEIGELANSFNNMTEQLQTTFEALKTSESKFRLLAENSNDMISTLNLDGTCTYISPSSYKITGYNFDEMVGHSIFEKIHPDDLAIVKNIQKLLYEGKNDTYLFSLRYLTKVGSYIWVETNLKIICDKNTDLPVEVQAVSRDITERKIFESELHKTIGEIQDLYNNAPCGYHSLDRNGYFVRINNTELQWLGYTREELIGKMKITDLLTDKSCANSEIKFKSLIETGYAKDLDFDLVAKDGTIISVLISSSAINDENGHFLYTRTTVYDVTNFSKLNNELMDSHKRLELAFKNLDVIIYQLDCNGIFTLSEGRGLSKLGLVSGQNVGSSIFDIYMDYPIIVNAAKEALSGKKAQNEVNVRGVIFDIIMSPSFDSNGNLNGVLGLSIDITGRKLKEQIIFEEKEQLKVTLQSIGDGVITTDNQGIITMINWVSEELTGWDNNSAVGKPLSEVFDIFNELSGEKCANPVELVLRTNKTVELANHTVLRSRDGTIRAIADTAAPILGKDNMIIGVVLVFRDVSEVNASQREIMYLNCHDTLTDLYNRNHFEKEVLRLESAAEYPISVIMGDVNGLKLTNDIFGHADGDKVLRAIADILSRCCRSKDIVARWGGDEFCVLLPSTNNNIVKDICNRITRMCEETHIYLGNGYSKVSISLGYATKMDNTEKLSDILRLAESSMYKRKLLDSKSMQSSLISSIKTTLFEKSQETEEHAYRIIENSKILGQLLNLTEDQMDDLELLAMLHDIGKIAIDDSIISKTGKLSAEERAEINRHPEIGFRIAQASPELIHIAQSILSHHERWDGTGYPQGLKEKEIPLLSRIIAIADAYDAMTNDRVYRKAMSTDEAIKEIRMNAGTQFDPEISNEFLNYISKV